MFIKRRIFVLILSAAVLICGARIFDVSGNSEYLPDDISSLSPIEQKLGFVKNDANSYGEIYSLDGVPLTKTESSDEPTAADEAYKLFVEQSKINCDNILRANSLRENKINIRGDSIQTTIHSKAQKTAYAEASKYANADGVYIAVVLKDGAVLCNVEFGECSGNPQTGSVFKCFLSRAMINLDDGSEYSLFNENFEDVSEVNVDGRVIHNWDYSAPSNYSGVSSGVYRRNVSLREALLFSSNTYFIRHSRYFTFEGIVEELNREFSFDKKMYGDIYCFSAVTNDSTARDTDFFFGQNACVNPLRLAASMNAVVSGKLNIPFCVANVTTVSGRKIYEAAPEGIDSGFEVDPESDILVSALKDCYLSYTAGDSELEALGGRLIAKSGTAERSFDRENRTLLMSVLDEDNDVICSAVILVENIKSCESPSNDELIRCLVNVLKQAEIL